MQMLSISSYDYAAPSLVAFGWGRRRELGSLSAPLGQRAFLIWGSRTLAGSPRGDELRDSLVAAKIELHELITLHREPEVEDVDRATTQLTDSGIRAGDLVIGIGGGAALDLAKAVAAMAPQTERASVRDYLEGVGRGFKLTKSPLKIVAIPTTAGTGSEATKNAVISGHDPPFKKSLRSNALLPSVVLVDPELTVSCSAAVTAHSGMDAITQLIESAISVKAKPIPLALAEQGLALAVPALATAVREPDDRPAREAMAHAALLSGMALANSGLGMAHGVAAALGVLLGVPHGLACATLLPLALRTNLECRRSTLARLERAIDPHASSNDAVAAEALVVRIEQLAHDLQIPKRLSELGVTRCHLPQLVAGSRGNSMDGNPRPLDDRELSDLLEAAL